MSATTKDTKRFTRRKLKDAQTGKDFDIILEGPLDTIFAWISAAYSLAVIGYLVWVILDLKYIQSPSTVTATLKPLLAEPTSKLIFYTALGGAMGAAVNNLRSFIMWHAEERAFGWRFIWKYLAMPPLGGTLAVLVYGILQSGMTVINGGNGPANSAVTALSAWATGTLAGYGSHKVFKWLDDKVNSLFKVDGAKVVVPDTKGKTLAEAKQLIADAKLELGATSDGTATGDQVGKVIAQSPEAGTEVDCQSKVDLTVGVASELPPLGGPTDLTTKPQEGGSSSGPSATDEAVASENGATETVDTDDGQVSEDQTVAAGDDSTTPEPDAAKSDNSSGQV